jgi:hypothetical protein
LSTRSVVAAPFIDSQSPQSGLHPMPTGIGRFSVLDVIGRGGEGTVYLGHDPQLNRPVAIKRLHRAEMAAPDVRPPAREARIHALLNDAHIVQVYELVRDERAEYIISEYVEGQTLAELLQQPLPLVRKLELALQIASGLRHAHERGVLHRDLKPSNVLIDKDGGARIADFGIALLRHALPEGGAGDPLLFSGTPCAMSPEQTLGQLGDERSDIFSLGLLYYELFTGTRAFDGASDQGVAAKIRGASQLPAVEVDASLPPELSRLIDRMLNKAPADRPASVALVLEALGSVVEQQRALAPASPETARRASCPLVCVVDCACEPSAAHDARQLESALALELELEGLVAGVAQRLEASVVAVYAGRVVACIGHPQAHERLAHAALRFVEKLEQAIAVRCAASGVPRLVLRCGMALGRVMVQEGQQRRVWAGVPFERAAALREAAAPGQPVVDAGVQSELQAVMETRPLGRLAGRGRGMPCAAFAVLSVLPETPFGAAAHPYCAKPLVGRKDVLDAMHAALLLGGRDARVHVYGPPGIGKSHLIHSLLAAPAFEAVRTVVIECAQARQYQAFGGVAELLKQLISLPSDADAALREQRFKARLATLGFSEEPLVSALGGVLLGGGGSERVPPTDGGERYHRVLNAAVALLAALAGRRSLLLVVEDGQWLDHSSRETLARLCQRLPGDQLKVLVSSREATRVLDFGMTTVELGPLPDEAAQDLLDGLSRATPLSAHERQRILHAAEGVPLLLELLAGSRDACVTPGLSHLEAGIAARLRELGEVGRIAEHAAVLGRTFSALFLARSVQLDDRALQGGLQALARAGLIVRQDDDDSWRFAHALVRDAIYQRMPAERRRALHAAVVEVAATDGANARDLSPSVLARHCAESGQGVQAAQHYRSAALAAMDAGAYFEARGLLEAALAALAESALAADSLAQERDLRLLYSQCLVTSEGWSSSLKRDNNERLRELNGRLGCLVTASDCMACFTMAMFSDRPDAARAAIAALEGLPAGDELSFVANTARGYLAFFAGHWSEALTRFDAAIAARERLDRRGLVAGAIAGCGLELLNVPDLQAAAIELARDRPERARRYVAAAPGFGQGAEPGVVALTFLGYGVTHALMVSDLPEGAARLGAAARALDALAAAQKNALYCTFAQLGVGYAQVLADDAAAGLKLMQRSHESMDAMGIRGGLRLFYDGYYIDALLRDGRADAASALLDERRAAAHGELATYCLPDYLLLAARVRHAGSDPRSHDAALSLLDDALLAAQALSDRDVGGPGARLVTARIERAWTELTGGPAPRPSASAQSDRLA